MPKIRKIRQIRQFHRCGFGLDKPFSNHLIGGGMGKGLHDSHLQHWFEGEMNAVDAVVAVATNRFL